LQFIIPSDGVLIVAATSCCDFGFTGEGGSSGTYQLSVAPVLVAGPISGRIVDAVSGTPLRGDVFPFALVELRRCQDNECFEVVSAQNTDRQGRFLFSNDFSGSPLIAGRYQVVAFAEQFEQGQTAPFDLGAGVERELGDVLLTPLPIQFFAVDPCGNIAPAGGSCTFSVRVRNSSATAFTGAAWSIITGSGIGSRANDTVFQTGSESGNPNPQAVVLQPAQSTFLQFQFAVPGTVGELASFCAETLVGQEPNPLFNTVGRRFLFCIAKEGGTFSVASEAGTSRVATEGSTFRVLPEKKARKLFQQLQRRR
jgi:hypothetical protein